MIKFNVTIPKKFTGKDGVEKKFWNNVGKITMFEANGEKEMGLKLEMFMFPDTPFFVFLDKPKTATGQADYSQTVNTSNNAVNNATEAPGASSGASSGVDDIDPEDIPF